MKKIIVVFVVLLALGFVVFGMATKVSQPEVIENKELTKVGEEEVAEFSMPVKEGTELLKASGTEEVVGLDEELTVETQQSTESEDEATTSDKIQPTVQYDVVIIGAGIAGLAAANKLKENGVSNVVILEARDRIGGRIFTDTIGNGIAVDLGASWIHGTSKNPISKIATENNIQTSVTNYDNDVVYDQNGEELDLSEDIWEDFQEYAWDTPNKALSKVFDDYADEESLDQDEARYLSYFINTTVEHELAAPIKNVSISSFDVGDEFGGPDVIFPGGYEQIINILAKGVDVRLESPVVKVDYGSELATVTTAGGEEFVAKHVVSTVPLGVLKNNYILFNPTLPEQKQQAINTLGMGVLNKTYLLFDEVFWDKDVEIIGFASDNKGQWAETLNLYPALGQPILLMFNAGQYAKETEQYTDHKIVSRAVATLKTMYGDVPNPTDYVVTRWGSDKWSGGAYSYIPKAVSSDVYDHLAKPVGNTLFFAGEATNKKYPATVHGAFLSGERAANEVLNILE